MSTLRPSRGLRQRRPAGRPPTVSVMSPRPTRATRGNAVRFGWPERLLAGDPVAVAVERAAVPGLPAVQRRRAGGPRRGAVGDSTHREEARGRERAGAGAGTAAGAGAAWAAARRRRAGRGSVPGTCRGPGHGVLLRRGHPEAVVAPSPPSAGRRRRSGRRVRRQPGGCVAVALALVQRAVDGEQVQRVVGEEPSRRAVQLLRALLPGVGQRDDMVDLHRRAAWPARAEVDRRGPCTGRRGCR